MTKGYNTGEIIAKFNKALKDAIKHNSGVVSISGHNVKMGEIKSVSVMPLLTCPAICGGTCGRDCYASRMANQYKQTLQAYARNTAIYLTNSQSYFLQVRASVAGVRWFRWHVAGDIIDTPYFAEMVEIARDNKHCKFLAFTKKYDIVNDYITNGGIIPDNLIVAFSGGWGIKIPNPYNMPVALMFDLKQGEKCPQGAKLCGGNCFNCAVTGCGCFDMKHGDAVAFEKH